jgi:hypothetical protein
MSAPSRPPIIARRQADPLEEWLRTVSRASAASRVTSSMDFTSLVMSRIEAQSASAQPAQMSTCASAPAREQLHAVAGTLAFSAFLLIISGVAFVRFEPAAAFATLSALVSGFVVVVTTARMVSDSLYAASTNNGLMLLVTALVGGSLLLWPQFARAAGRVTGEA